MEIKTITILKLGNGWYDFKNIPQGYIKIHGLNCGNDTKAMKQAKKMNTDYSYTIKEN